MVFWFCDECEAYLNIQDGFNRDARKHLCKKCGYENDTTFENIKGTCSDCGKILPDPDATLCADCRQARREKAKQWLITAGKVAAGIAVVVGVAVLAASAAEDDDSTEYTPLPDDVVVKMSALPEIEFLRTDESSFEMLEKVKNFFAQTV